MSWRNKFLLPWFVDCACTSITVTNKNLKVKENHTCEVDAHMKVHVLVFLRCEYPNNSEIN